MSSYLDIIEEQPHAIHRLDKISTKGREQKGEISIGAKRKKKEEEKRRKKKKEEERRRKKKSVID